ncbi:MAG: hypothetical protein PUF61_05820 [Spirochaetales bacterium]|nr:hypothetical protein [Spirochaetales bacterium]
MKKRIIGLIFLVLIAILLCALTPFVYDEDIYSNKKREEIISKKILKCKDVVDVKVKEHGSEQSRADIEITLTNGRFLVLSSYGIHLRSENLWIKKIGDIVPIEFGYDMPQRNIDGSRRMISLGIIAFSVSDFEYLDNEVKSIKDISTLINNYDLVYFAFSHLPDADENFPCVSYWETTSETEIRCELWEKMENPYFYKTENNGGKFYKMTEEALNKYYEIAWGS